VVALTIIVFFVGMTLLAFTLIVVESVWVVALVGIVHITASAVLGIMIVRRLGEEDRRALEDEEAAPR
jgi:uncharacterized membrane protein YdjX (TVP38/TMEM64 family)